MYGQESVSSITEKNNSVNMNDNDKDLSMKETKSPSLSVVKSKLNTKFFYFVFSS